MKSIPTTLCKDDTRALWYAVQAFADAVSAMRNMEQFTPERVEAERALLVTAKRALRKVNAIRKAQPPISKMRNFATAGTRENCRPKRKVQADQKGAVVRAADGGALV